MNMKMPKLKFNFEFFKQRKGVFKFIQLVLVFTMFLISRFSNLIEVAEKSMNVDIWILVCVLPVASGLIICCIILHYLLNGRHSILEDILNIFGIIMFLLTGMITMYAGFAVKHVPWWDKLFAPLFGHDLMGLFAAFTTYGSISILTMAILSAEFIWFRMKNSLKFDFEFFKQQKGIFKLIQLVLVFTMFLISRCSNLIGIDLDARILVCVLPVASGFIITCIILHHLSDGRHLILEDILNIFGIVLFLVTGIITFLFGYNLAAWITYGIFSIVTMAVLIAEFIWPRMEN